MRVTNVNVSFLREKQPAKFEKSQPAVEFSAVLDESDNHEAVARKLMISATAVVYNGLGYDVPERVATALASGVVPAELSVATKTAEVAPEGAEGAGEAPETEATKPKTRGRPRGSKNTAPKKGSKAAKEAEAKAAAAKENDGIPGDDDPTPNISTGGERVNPEDEISGDVDAPEDDRMASDDEVPGEETEAEFTPKDLHTLIMLHVNATPRTLSVANAKQVLAHFKVARAQDLTNEQALEGKALVEKMLKAIEVQKG